MDLQLICLHSTKVIAHRLSPSSPFLRRLAVSVEIFRRRRDEEAVAGIFEHYTNRRYRESLYNWTPADVYFGRAKTQVLKANPHDEVTANLIHANYISGADLIFCQDFDIGELEGEPGFDEIQALHQALLAILADAGIREAAE